MKRRVTQKADALLLLANNYFITQTVKLQQEQMELQQRQMEQQLRASQTQPTSLGNDTERRIDGGSYDRRMSE